jgi:hypothetical protein
MNGVGEIGAHYVTDIPPGVQRRGKTYKRLRIGFAGFRGEIAVLLRVAYIKQRIVTSWSAVLRKQVRYEGFSSVYIVEIEREEGVYPMVGVAGPEINIEELFILRFRP